MIQRPEELINPVLGVRSYIAYTTDMKKVFATRKPVRIVFVKITTYRALLSILEYDTCMLLMKKTGAGVCGVYTWLSAKSLGEIARLQEIEAYDR